MSPMSAEATVVRNYIETLVGLPWKKKSKISKDLAAAEKILDEDHYGLEKVKERIVEYLAVQQRVDKLKAPILCLVGPPGVGKTSLGQSIARATNRKFVRMSLGGVRDEAEIRGHRRTYIGSMPGKILQNMTKVGVRNPLFLLDEVDKMGMDFRGDPSSALLEVLDPEQNHTFVDHYVEVEYDLSDVMFVATANTLNIPPPLLDRMEVIRLSGYTEDEKVNIAMQLPAAQADEEQRPEGRRAARLRERDARHRPLLHARGGRARARARDLEDLPQGGEGAAAAQSEGKARDQEPVDVTAKNLDKYLGVRRYTFGMAEKKNQVGQVTGLAWTEVGGELLTIEARRDAGQGQDDHHRQAGRGDAGVDPGRALGGAQPLAEARHRRGLLPEERHAHPPARGRDAEGRPERRHRHRHRDGVGAHRHSGARGCGDDRRDHAARRSAADRRPEGEAARGASRRHQDRADPGGEREGSRRRFRTTSRTASRSIRCKWIDQVLEMALERQPEPLPDTSRRRRPCRRRPRRTRRRRSSSTDAAQRNAAA